MADSASSSIPQHIRSLLSKHGFHEYILPPIHCDLCSHGIPENERDESSLIAFGDTAVRSFSPSSHHHAWTDIATLPNTEPSSYHHGCFAFLMRHALTGKEDIKSLDLTITQEECLEKSQQGFEMGIYQPPAPLGVSWSQHQSHCTISGKAIIETIWDRQMEEEDRELYYQSSLNGAESGSEHVFDRTVMRPRSSQPWIFFARPEQKGAGKNATTTYTYLLSEEISKLSFEDLEEILDGFGWAAEGGGSGSASSCKQTQAGSFSSFSPCKGLNKHLTGQDSAGRHVLSHSWGGSRNPAFLARLVGGVNSTAKERLAHHRKYTFWNYQNRGYFDEGHRLLRTILQDEQAEPSLRALSKLTGVTQTKLEVMQDLGMIPDGESMKSKT